jgi:hypothetical protein
MGSSSEPLSSESQEFTMHQNIRAVTKLAETATGIQIFFFTPQKDDINTAIKKEQTLRKRVIITIRR